MGDKSKPATMPKSIRFLFGGLSGMGATCFVQPLDLVKNRMQLISTGAKAKERTTSFQVVRAVIKNEGFTGLYSGLSAGLLRQASYTTVRMGVFTSLQESMSKDGKNPSFIVKACLGMFAGACGAFFGNPADISLVRMTADGRLPKAEQRGYKHVFDALFRIVKEEGVLTLWRGCVPTIGRSMVVNGAQLSSYSQAKQMLLETGYFKDNITLHFVASMIAGLITTIASMPVDIAKTRIQNMKIIDGKPEYTGAIDVITKILKNEGVSSLWKGFTPYYARLGPHTVLTFIILEQMNSLYKKHVMKEKIIA
ncbi:mitochondrial 2-oxoglutarate/malate carrier protein-like protein [Leptotrombidium deliense]|uniref:Mitochondrial 2-oxoglutarate/malate carrier protein n=1 Tax=Leptotrombidium deliense TaxID=299467 RepID=A0A443SJN1_9ACAR|nr:mitochondrial 2-oxoglutarate/malate carrier protein-like protein [Leptotrombidium deliense]